MRISSTILRVCSCLLALLLFALPFEYCMAGWGLGFPFAWLHPGHGEWGTFALDPESKHGQVINMVHIGISLLIYFTLVGGALWVRRHNRRNVHRRV